MVNIRRPKRRRTGTVGSPVGRGPAPKQTTGFSKFQQRRAAAASRSTAGTTTGARDSTRIRTISNKGRTVTQRTQEEVGGTPTITSKTAGVVTQQEEQGPFKDQPKFDPVEAQVDSQIDPATGQPLLGSDQEGKTFAQRTTELLLTPSEFIANNVLGPLTEAITGNKQNVVSAEEFAATTTGKVFATVLATAGTLAVAQVAVAAWTTTRGVLAAARVASQAKSITKISKMFKIPEEVVRERIRKKAVSKSIDKAVRGVSGKALAVGVGAGTFIAGSVASTDTMYNWFALDNVLGAQGIYLNKVLKAVQSGHLNAVDAAEAVEGSQELRGIARTKLEISAKINPITMLFKKLILAGAEGAEIDAQLTEDLIFAAGEDAAAGGIISTKSAFDQQAQTNYLETKHAYELQEIDYYASMQLRNEIQLRDSRLTGTREQTEELLRRKREILALEKAAAAERDKLWAERNAENYKRNLENIPSRLGFGLL